MLISGNMVDTYEDGRLFVHAASVPSLFKIIDERHWEPQNSMASDIPGDGIYTVFDSLEEAHKVFRHEPWRIREFSQKDDKIRNEDSPGNDVTYDVTGDYMDIGRFLDGEPEDFGVSFMGNPRRIFATIEINLAAAKWTTTEYIIQKQKRVLRLVDWLEQYGIRTRIRASLVTDVGSLSVLIKDHQDYFDLNHLAIAMHPDFTRRTALLVFEQSDRWEFGYGDAVSYDDLTLLSNYADPENGISIYVGGYMPYAPDDTEKGYTYENDLTKLNEDFDNIEKKIAEMISNEQTFTEIPLKVGRPFLKVARTKRDRADAKKIGFKHY